MRQTVIACHECDLLQRVGAVPPHGAARCIRCGGLLFRNRPDSLHRSLALSVAGLFLFIMANSSPILTFKLEGQTQATTLITGIRELYHQGLWEVALVVLLTSVLAPLAQICGNLYILLPLNLRRVPWKAAGTFRFILRLQPWSMMEVFLLGILIAIVKLAKMAEIVPGTALYAFGALIFVLAAAAASIDPHAIWDRVGAAR
jgi:paraquat-inducible protein A